MISMILVVLSLPLTTGEYLTREEALELAFPECEIERTTVLLSKEQRERASELAGFEIDERVVHPYVATKDGKHVGTAWFDVHVVRTKKEALMVVVSPDEEIARLELLAFAEPEEYVPRASFYAQFVGRVLDDELRLDRGIRGVTGATLTARSTTSSVRRMLAISKVLSAERRPDGR